MTANKNSGKFLIILFQFLVFFLLFLSLPSFAEVYLLRPERSKDGSGSAKLAGDIFEALAPRRLWTEEIVVNGISISIDIALLEITFQEARQNIKSSFPEAKFASNKDSFLAEITASDGRRKRIYVVELGAFFPCIQFAAILPEKKIPSEFLVPQEIENLIPPESKIVNYYSLPKRNSICVNFNCSFEPEMAMSMLKTRASSVGWKSFDNTQNAQSVSKCATFFQGSSPMQIMLVDIVANGGGGSVGTIIVKSF